MGKLRRYARNEPTCTHRECLRKSFCRSLCSSHYMAAWRMMDAHREAGDFSASATLLAWKAVIPELLDAGFSGPITKNGS